MFIKEVFSHSAVRLGHTDPSQAADVVAQLLNGVMAVSEEVLLQEVTQLQNEEDKKTHSKIKAMLRKV